MVSKCATVGAMVDEGEGGAATYDDKGRKGVTGYCGTERLIENEKKTSKRTKRGYINPMYCDIPSTQRHGLDLRVAVHNLCAVDRQDFRGGTHLWRLPTCLGRSTSLHVSIGAQRAGELTGKGSMIRQRW